MNYDLSHLVQPPEQAVMGPLQDDEALLLYAVCKVCQIRTVIEFGGLQGYSATNFLKAMGPDGRVWSVDADTMPDLGPNHTRIHKELKDVVWKDFTGLDNPVDLVFFDIHDLDGQLKVHSLLKECGLLGPRTLLALHDTGLHPNKETDWSAPHPTRSDRWIHQQVERSMTDRLRSVGYESVSFHCDDPKPPLRYRHGLTIMRFGQDFAVPAFQHRYTVCRPGVEIR